MATTSFSEKSVRIQDEGSQLVGEIAAFAGAEHGRAANILDLCAAPGGKTLILIERNPKARVVACEASEQRLAQLEHRLANFAGRVECRLADATKLTDRASFDLVLADAPCSGTGTLGRNPEIRHRLHAEDLPRQAGRQRAILSSAMRAVRPRGRVVYATCSLEPEENEQVIASVLAENQNVRQLPILPCIDGMTQSGVLISDGAKLLRECVSPEGALRLLPDLFGTDGFFVALLEARD
jgi:16S rRNA (cytosine967-C5)-methyltransferase